MSGLRRAWRWFWDFLWEPFTMSNEEREEFHRGGGL